MNFKLYNIYYIEIMCMYVVCETIGLDDQANALSKSEKS